MTQQAWFESARGALESRLRHWAGVFCAGVPSVLQQAWGHLLLASGKRLRPLLTLAASTAVSGECFPPLVAVDVACAVEMLHTYSLIQDDLPCMDNDDLRRGLPSTHKQHGEAVALLASDALLTNAVQVILTSEFSDAQRVYILRVLMDAVGTQGMLLGQFRDIVLNLGGASLEEVTTLHRQKTGALIRAAVVAGALAAGATEAQCAQLDRFADALGMAFQVMDDVLDVTGKSGVLGKTPGKDKKLGKTTFVDLFGTQGARNVASEQLQQALEAIQTWDISAIGPLRALAAMTVDRTA